MWVYTDESGKFNVRVIPVLKHAPYKGMYSVSLDHVSWAAFLPNDESRRRILEGVD